MFDCESLKYDLLLYSALVDFSRSYFRTAKTILEAVVGLSFDDPPSNLAAAALFYILTSDVSCWCYDEISLSNF